MTIQEQDAFRDYVGSIEDQLLEAVAADYIWLASQSDDQVSGARFEWRRATCHEECTRRGKPRIWRRAERAVGNSMAQVA
jgi:hypothetical protein